MQKPIQAPKMRNPDFSSWVANGRPTCAALDRLLGQTYGPLGDNVSCVALLDYMGNEAAILRYARMSTGREVQACDENGRPIAEADSRLLPRLLRDQHTSPFEFARFVFGAQVPIFVARQWVRHRMESLSEASGRYTILDPEYFVPESYDVRFESGVDTSQEAALAAHDIFVDAMEAQARAYERLVERGVHREQARIVLGTGFYTRFACAMDLHNLMHFLTLRMAPDAQSEFRSFANVMWAILAQMSPLCALAVMERIQARHPKARLTNGEPMTVGWVIERAAKTLQSAHVPPPYRAGVEAQL